MRLLQRSRCRTPRSRTIRPAQRYLALGAEEARRRGHGYVGTEHVLLVLVSDPESGAAHLLARLGVAPEQVGEALARWLADGPSGGAIDPDALATLGIDFDAVREQLEQTFGPDALEQTHTACLGIAPRLKLALAFALDHAAGGPLTDEQVLLGMLSVPDSVAARVLGELGVSFEEARELVG